MNVKTDAVAGGVCPLASSFASLSVGAHEITRNVEPKSVVFQPVWNTFVIVVHVFVRNMNCIITE